MFRLIPISPQPGRATRRPAPPAGANCRTTKQQQRNTATAIQVAANPPPWGTFPVGSATLIFTRSSTRPAGVYFRILRRRALDTRPATTGHKKTRGFEGRPEGSKKQALWVDRRSRGLCSAATLPLAGRRHSWRRFAYASERLIRAWVWVCARASSTWP